MKDDTSLDLLEMITWRSDHPEVAEKAFNEFFLRFKANVWKAAYALARYSFKDNINEAAQDIFSDTFITVFEKAHLFTPEKDTDPDLSIRKWLNRITKNQFLRRNEERTKNRQYSVYLENIPESENIRQLETIEEDNLIGSPNSQLIEQALSILNEKERDILMTSLNFQDEKSPPKEVRSNLCRLYSIKEDSLRKVNERALKKMRDSLVKKQQNPVINASV